MLSVSKLAKKFGLSRATILYYEKEGLLEPALRASNGYRFYGEKEVERLRRITGYRSYGVPVSDIRELLERESNATIERVRLIKILDPDFDAHPLAQGGQARLEGRRSRRRPADPQSVRSQTSGVRPPCASARSKSPKPSALLDSPSRETYSPSTS